MCISAVNDKPTENPQGQKSNWGEQKSKGEMHENFNGHS